MGVCCIIIRCEDKTIDELAATPTKIFHFYDPEDMPEPKPQGFIGKLLGFKPVVYPICSTPRQANDSIDVDKSWDGLDFLISNGRKETGAARLLTTKGIKINREVGYGKPQAFYSGTVAEFNDLLQSLTMEDLRNRYDAKKMRKLYLGLTWSRPDGEEYLLSCYEILKEFIRVTTNLKQGIVVIHS